MSAWPPSPPDPSTLAPSEVDDYEAVAGRQRRMWGLEPTGYFGAILNSPYLAAAVSELGRRVRTLGSMGSLPDHVRETTDLVLSIELNDPLVYSVHLPDAIAVGVRPEMVAALLDGTDDFTDDERLVVGYIRDVLHGRVDAEQFDRVAERLSVRGAVELTVTTGFLISTMRCMQALGATAELGEWDMRGQLQGFLDGTAEVPDPKAHTG